MKFLILQYRINLAKNDNSMYEDPVLKETLVYIRYHVDCPYLSLCVGILAIQTSLSCGVFSDYDALEP